MKKKCAFLVSILLCISMVMTNFAGLGNSIIEAKADGDSATIACPVVKVTVNNDQWGTAGVFTGDVTQPEMESDAGNILQLKATASDDDVYFDQWSLTGAGTIENVNDNQTNFTVGAENATIQAIFKEKEELNYTVEIDNWAEDEDVKEPIVKDANGNQVLGGVEYGYYIDEDCLYPTTPANSGAEDSACAPKKAGKYYVKVWIYPETDQYKIKIVTIPFSVLKRITIKLASGQDEVTYAPGLVYELSKLFIFPDGAGTRTYEIADDPNDNSVGKGTINGDKLTVTKTGAISIKVTTEETDTVTSAKATAVLTVKKADLNNNMLSVTPAAYDNTSGSSFTPELSVYDGETKLEFNVDYEIKDTSVTSANSIGKYTIYVTGKGNYKGEANISWQVIDKASPVISEVKDDEEYYNEVTVKVNDDDLESVTIQKDSENPVYQDINNSTSGYTIKDIGVYTVIATDKAGNTSTCTFTIAQKKVTVKAEDTNITYTPNATFDVKNLFTISDQTVTANYYVVDANGIKTLLKDTVINISGAGDINIYVKTDESTYIASAEKNATLKVNKANGSVTITVDDIVYGSKPSPTVSSDTNTNYSIKYKGDGETVYGESTDAPTKVGSYIATVTYEATDNYEACSELASFKITAKDIDNCTINVTNNITDFEYDKQEHNLSFTVSDGTITLGSTDYEIDQKSKASATDIGEYTVTINGIGNYKGTNSIKWKISDTKKPVISGTTGNTYLNKAEITVTDDYLDSVTLKNNDNNSVKNDYVKNNGSATITVETPGSFTITATDTSGNENEYSFVVFTEPQIAPKENNTTISIPTDNYDVTSLFNIPEGTGTATYSIFKDSTNAAELSNGLLKLIYAGTVEIEVSTAPNGYVATGSAIALITGKAIDNSQGQSSGTPITGLVEIYGKTYYYIDGKKVTAADTANLYAPILDGAYYVNKDGEVAMNGIFKVEGVDRLFRENGSIVSYNNADVQDGKITVGGVVYVINPTTNAAARDDIRYNVKVNWTVKFPSSFTKGTAAPVLKYKVTYTSANTGETKTTDEISVTATTSNNFSSGSADKEVTFTAVADLNGYFEDKEGTKPAVNVALSKTYKFKEGFDVSGSGSESGKSAGEAEDNVTYNLFYTDAEISIPLPEGADPSKGSGKWTEFYTVDASGAVTLKVTDAKDVKKATNANYSLIIMPIFEDEVQIGEFEYQLPVFYLKPALKLSSKSGSVKKGVTEAQTLYTTVLEKKSTGVYEPIDVNAQKEGVQFWNNKSGTAPTVEAGDNDGELVISASAKAAGKIAIQHENWREVVVLTYSIKESNKSVLLASTKQVSMNVNANASTGEETVSFTLNGSDDISAESGISVEMPKKWDKANIEVEGIENGALTSNTVSFKYKREATPVKGNYTFTFKTSDNAKTTVKVAVSNKALDKAVNLKVVTKMDVTRGQPMVLVPNLKDIGGHIDSIELADENFEVEYNEDLNQVYVSVAEGKSVAAGKFDKSFKVVIDGVECTANVKTKITAKSPTVKIAKVNLPKKAGAEGEASIRATVKQAGKIFEVAPTAVTFTNGTANEELGEGWFTVEGVAVKWNAESGTISVKVVDETKIKKTVKVELTFAGNVKIKKPLTIKAK